MQTATVTIYGRQYVAKVLRVHPCGTLDVQLPSGRCFRVSGLSHSSFTCTPKAE